MCVLSPRPDGHDLTPDTRHWAGDPGMVGVAPDGGVTATAQLCTGSR